MLSRVSSWATSSSLMTEPPQPRAPTDPAHPHAPLVQLVAPAADDVAVEAHEEAHLVRASASSSRSRTRTRTGGSRRPRWPRRRRRAATASPASCPLVRGRPRGVGPAAVAVHDDGDVPRQPVGGDDGRSGAARVRERRRRTGLRRRVSRSRHTLDGRSERTALEVPLEEGGHEPAALAAVPQVGGVGDGPVAGEQRGQEPQRLGRRGRRARRAARGADRTAGDDVEAPGAARGHRTSRSRGSSAPSPRPRASAAGRRRARGPGRARRPASERRAPASRRYCWSGRLVLLGEPVARLEHRRWRRCTTG